MKKIGIICEYNPFHNGHVYHIKKVKEMYPDSLIVLVLNGYFLERGEVSILSKEDKTKLALSYLVDLVVELPFIFGTQSADVFAYRSIEILNHLQVDTFVFGSESNDPRLFMDIAKIQMQEAFHKNLKKFLKTGVNYPTALSKAMQLDKIIKEPNDLLGISYAKAILKTSSSIELKTIKRTNNYHDLESEENIVSASNIREKINQNKSIHKYVPESVSTSIKKINYDLMWTILKYKIITSDDLCTYLTVDEGIEVRLKKMAVQSENLKDFILKVKTKRYTYNKIRRMIIHILLGLKKEDTISLELQYIHILGFNTKGQEYLKAIKKHTSISLTPVVDSKQYEYEKKAAFLYDLLTDAHTSIFETRNKPIIKEEIK